MLELALFYFFLGLGCEFIDSHLGGGYGTIITPLSIIIGLPLQDVILSILVSEIFTGILGGILYNKFATINKKAALVIISTACVGSLIGSFASLNIPKLFISTYIGILVIGLGILMLLNKKSKTFRSWKASLLGSLIGFNKALTGGGFGPICTAGLHLSGIKAKISIGTTLLSEGFVCILAAGIYLVSGRVLNLSIFLPLAIGSIIGCVAGSLATKRSKSKTLRILAGVFITVLGIWTLVKTLIF